MIKSPTTSPMPANKAYRVLCTLANAQSDSLNTYTPAVGIAMDLVRDAGVTWNGRMTDEEDRDVMTMFLASDNAEVREAALLALSEG